MIDFDKIRLNYPLENYYLSKNPGSRLRKTGKWLMAKCPFHSDNNPSFGIANGTYWCFGCGAFGDVFDLARFYGDDLSIGYEVKEVIPKYQSIKRKTIDPIPIEIIIKSNKNIWNDQELSSTREFLNSDRGLEDKTIALNYLGWTWNKGGRITIPVFKPQELVPIDLFGYDHNSEDKFVSMFGPRGSLPYVPVTTPKIASDTLWIVEGELDCLLLNQEFQGAYNVVTNTHGAACAAGTWKTYRHLIDSFQEINICLDVDAHDKSVDVAESLYGHGNVSVLEWDKSFSKAYSKGDVTDFLVKNKSRPMELYDMLQDYN